MTFNTSVPLSRVAELVSVKVPSASLVGGPYISTENMLPDLGGVVDSGQPPDGRVNSFHKTDTLFSNIRPYFRKVQFAQTSGGCSADVLVFRTKNAQVFHPAYLYYCLADPKFIEHTMATCKGAKMPRGDKEAMLLYEVAVPELELQKRVANFLQGVDELQETLKHQNAALETIAQTLFRSWFVRFDPVHAKVAGMAPEAMSPELASLFPSEFEESELGLIPKGWAVTSFGDAFRVQGGGTPSTATAEYWEGGTHKWATPKDMSGLPSKVIYETERKLTSVGVQKISSKVLPADTVLMSSRAPVGYLAIAKAPVSINQGFIAIPPTAGFPPSFILELLSHKMPIIEQNSGGSTFAEISKTQFRPIRWVRPSAGLIGHYGRIAESLYASIHGNCLVIDALASLRDHLLPRLISGKLSLEDAQEAVEELLPA